MHRTSALVLAIGFAFISASPQATVPSPLSWLASHAVQVEGVTTSPMSPGGGQELEYFVWSAVLSQEFVTRLKCEPLNIETPSLQPENATEFASEANLEGVFRSGPISGLEPETRESYLANIHSPVNFERKFNLAVEYKIIETMLPENYSKASRPCAFVRLSRPGLNRSGTQALVYAEYYCGFMCGAGFFFLLEKEKGAWTVKDTRVTWIP